TERRPLSPGPRRRSSERSSCCGRRADRDEEDTARAEAKVALRAEAWTSLRGRGTWRTRPCAALRYPGVQPASASHAIVEPRKSSRLDPPTYAGVAAGLSGVAGLASYVNAALPARRRPSSRVLRSVGRRGVAAPVGGG